MEGLSYKVARQAVHLFETKGYENVTMRDIAEDIAIKEFELYRLFGSKQEIVIFLFLCINVDWQEQVASFSKGKLDERFRKAMYLKIDLMADYERFLCNIIGDLLQNNAISVKSFQTAHIRTIALKTIQHIVDGSTDAKTLKKKVKNLSSLLFMMHWGVILLHLHMLDKTKTKHTIDLMTTMIHKINSYSLFLSFIPFVNEIGEWANQIALDEHKAQQQINNDILSIMLKYRKTIDGNVECTNNTCATCYQINELNVDYFTRQNLPVHFILPAFPAKSPNISKVLGKLPDLGEEIALHTLNNLCNEIKAVYEPGAKITICSDGRIFSDLVEVNDEEISHYINEVKHIIEQHSLSNIDVVNLEDLMEGDSFDDLRKKVLEKYAEPFESLKIKLKDNEEFKKLFNGMHRFIVEDRKFLFPELSTTKIKEESKEIALKLIQHSNAWTRFLNYVYPKSIRLSIHPYHPHASKIGIKLTKAFDNWITPWHGVIVLQEDGYVLMKKNEAEEKNATLIIKNNRPYYYTLIQAK